MIAVWLAAIFCFGFALPIASGWRRKRRLDRLADLLYEGRLCLMLPLRLRALAPNETELAAKLGVLGAVTEELQAAGLTKLGDLVEDIDAERMPQIARRLGSAQVQRVFASADGLVFGSCSPSERVVKVEFLSARDGNLYVTCRSARPARAADPPFVHARHFGVNTSLSSVLDAHRALLVEEPGTWARVESLEQYVHEAERARQREIAWREAQAPDALLDLDVRALFGERLYAWIGRELTARLAMRRDVAKARVVAPKKSSPGAPS